MIRPGVGVIIGRFQVADLHEGHVALIAEADKHSKLCIFIGVEPSRLGVQAHPLDYATREQMVKLSYPSAQVFEIVDQYTDEHWSKLLDARLHTLYPRDRVTLYCGRDSFRSHYKGKYEVKELDTVQHLSGTDLRAIDGATVENHASFRRGVIYAAYNRWDPVYPCVDIACTRHTATTREVLVGKRDEEGGALRFPGGHIDPSDDSDEDAARRELEEETGIAAGAMRYIWSGRIKSRGDREGSGTKRTALYHTEYAYGAAVGKDDLPNVFWIPMSTLSQRLWADDHAMLADRLVGYLSGGG